METTNKEEYLCHLSELLHQRIDIITEEKKELEKLKETEDKELVNQAMYGCNQRISEVNLFRLHIQQELLNEILKNKH